MTDNASSSFTVRTLVVLAMSALLVTAGSTGALAAQPSIDTETTNTPSESDYIDGATIVYNETADAGYLQYIADTGNNAVTIEDEDGNEVYYNDSAEVVDASFDTYRVALDSVDDLGGAEVGGGETVNLTTTIINDTTATNPDTLELTLKYEHTKDSANIIIDDADAGNSEVVEFGALGLSQYVPYFGSDVKSATVEETFTIAGQNTTNATFTMSNASIEDALVESVDGEDDGAWSPSAYGEANDHFVPVFAEENPDVDWLDTSEDAYAVADDDGSTVTVHNLDALTSNEDTEVEFTMHANEKMGFFNAKSMFNDLDVGVTSWTLNALKAMSVPAV